jgi:transcriptional regulator with XRE-family HTH domain
MQAPLIRQPLPLSTLVLGVQLGTGTHREDEEHHHTDNGDGDESSEVHDAPLETHGPIVVRRRLGAVLKRLRGEHGLPLDAVARQLEISPSKLSRLESGQVAPRIRDVRDLLEIYAAPTDVRARALAWADQAKEPGWWQPFSAAIPADLDMYISLEAEAAIVKMYSLPVSGLLQTERYARALLAGGAPLATTAQLERLVEIRMRRQLVLDPQRADVPPLDLHVVLDETALHRGVSAEILHEQIEELVNRSAWPNVTLQVLPFDAGWVMASSTFAIFEPRETTDWPVVNVESAGNDAYFDSPGDVGRYRAMWNDVVDRALDPAASRTLLRRLADEAVSAT